MTMESKPTYKETSCCQTEFVKTVDQETQKDLEGAIVTDKDMTIEYPQKEQIVQESKPSIPVEKPQ